MLDRLKIAGSLNWDFLGFGLAQLAYIEMYKLIVSQHSMPYAILDAYWGSAAIAAMIAGFAAFAGISLLRLRSFTITIALVQTILGILLFSVERFAFIPEAAFAYAILFGMGCALLWIAWEDKLAELDATSIVFYVTACAFVMAFFHVSSTLVPTVHAALVICAQLGAFVLLLSGFEAGTWKKEPKKTFKEKGVLAIDSPLPLRSLVMMTFVFVFSYHFAARTIYSETPNIFKDAEDIASACIMLFIFFFAKKCDFSKILKVSLPLIILSYLLVQLLPESSRSVCIIVSGSASKLIQLFLIAATIHAAGSCNERTRWIVLSFSIAAMFAGRLMSDLCVEGIDLFAFALNPDSTTIYVLLAVFILALLILPTMHPRDKKAGAYPSCGTETMARNVEHVVKEASIEYCLTARETEVLALLAQGRTQATVAKKLCISKGTAHAHVSHIYSKMDVHSRQELLDLIEDKLAVQ